MGRCRVLLDRHGSCIDVRPAGSRGRNRAERADLSYPLVHQDQVLVQACSFPHHSGDELRVSRKFHRHLSAPAPSHPHGEGHASFHGGSNRVGENSGRLPRYLPLSAFHASSSFATAPKTSDGCRTIQRSPQKRHHAVTMPLHRVLILRLWARSNALACRTRSMRPKTTSRAMAAFWVLGALSRLPRGAFRAR